MTDRQPIGELPRLLDAPSTDPALRDALRVVRDDAPDAMSLALLADGVQRAVGGTGAPHATAPASSMSAAGKTVVAAVVALAGAYGAYRLAAPPAERAAQPPAQAPVREPAIAQPEAAEEELTSPRAASPEPAGTPRTTPTSPLRAAPGARPAGASSHATAEPAPRQRAVRTQPSRRLVGSGPSPVASPAPPEAQPPVAPSAESAAARTEPAPDELMLLERAQRALQGDPEGAVEQLEEHGARFPSGAFAQEREALLIDALSRVGRGAEMRSRARAFLVRWPGSPHRARVQRLLDGP